MSERGPKQHTALPLVEQVDIYTVLPQELDDPGFTAKWRLLVTQNPILAREIIKQHLYSLRSNEESSSTSIRTAISSAMSVISAIEAALARQGNTVDDTTNQ